MAAILTRFYAAANFSVSHAGATMWQMGFMPPDEKNNKRDEMPPVVNVARKEATLDFSSETFASS